MHLFIAILLLIAAPPTAMATGIERQAIIERMQPALHALAAASSHIPTTQLGATPLDSLFDAPKYAAQQARLATGDENEATPPTSDLERARLDYYARLKAHALDQFVPRSRQLLILMENLWNAAGGFDLKDERKLSLTPDSPPWNIIYSLSRQIEMVRGGRASLATKPNMSFTDVTTSWGSQSADHPEGGLTTFEFHSLVNDSLSYAIKQSKSLEEILPLLNRTVLTLTGKESHEIVPTIVDMTPTELYASFDGEHLLSLLAQAGEKIDGITMVSTSPFWHRFDLPSWALQIRSLLIHENEATAAFDYLLGLLKYKMGTATDSETPPFKNRIIDFLEDNLLRQGPRGTLIGNILVGSRAFSEGFITAEEFTTHVLNPASHSIFGYLDSPWAAGHNPLDLTYGQGNARLELAALLRAISWNRERLQSPGSQNAIRDFLLKLFYLDPTFEYTISNFTRSDGSVERNLVLNKQSFDAQLVVPNGGAWPLVIIVSEKIVKNLNEASTIFKDFFRSKNAAGAKAALHKMICENELTTP